MKIHVVTTGEYSDYSISTVFTSKKLAERFANEIGGNVETFKVVTEMPKKIVRYVVEMQETYQGFHDLRTWTLDYWDFEVSLKDEIIVRRRVRLPGKVNPVRGFIRVICNSPERATKILSDKIAQFEAERQEL